MKLENGSPGMIQSNAWNESFAGGGLLTANEEDS